MLPTIVDRPAFHLVGVQRKFTPATMAMIPGVWDLFVPRIEEIENACGDLTYGVCEEAVDGRGTFAYTAAIEVEDLSCVPEGMVGFTVPAGAWAVFMHRGHISKIVETFDAIAGTWLAAANLARRDAKDLEVYDESWDPATGLGDVGIHIPVHAPR